MQRGRRITEFPDDRRDWRIVWLGGIGRHPETPGNFTIDVVLEPLAIDVRDLTSWRLHHPASRASHDAVRVTVPVGEFPSLLVGSVWRGGYRVRVPRYKAGEVTADFPVPADAVMPASGDLPVALGFPPGLPLLPDDGFAATAARTADEAGCTPQSWRSTHNNKADGHVEAADGVLRVHMAVRPRWAHGKRNWIGYRFNCAEQGFRVGTT